MHSLFIILYLDSVIRAIKDRYSDILLKAFSLFNLQPKKLNFLEFNEAYYVLKILWTYS